MKNFRILGIDYYEIPMVTAFILTDKADEISGFESFYRKSKKPFELLDYYIFSGELKIKLLIETIKKEIKDPEFVDTFLALVKINPEKKSQYEGKIRDFFATTNMDFEYTVIPEGSKLYAQMPAFQFKGPRWIGLLLEGAVTNIINGRTGLATFKEIYNAKAPHLWDIVNDNTQSEYFKDYLERVRKNAKALRASTSKPIMDASYRRAPGYIISIEAAKIAIQEGMNGTSNVAAFFESDEISIDMIGGTMAHAFITSFPTELEAFKAWNEIFPNTSMLVDTYDTINAVKLLISQNIKPESVRIDSGDFNVVCFEVRKILDEAGWNDVGIYISGDLSVAKFKALEKNNVPYDKAMVGTKYVNIDEGINVNAGFVYKIVEYTTKDGKKYLPAKKAKGKGNFPGLKTISIKEDNTVVLSVSTNSFGFEYGTIDYINSSKIRQVEYVGAN